MKVLSLNSLVGPEVSRLFLKAMVSRITPYYKHCEVELARVSLDDIIPLARFVVVQRIERARLMVSTLTNAQLEPFEIVCVEESHEIWLVMPPLVEVSDAGTFLIDGTHRILACKHEGASSVKVAVIIGYAIPPLPCEPSTWERVQVSDTGKPLHENLVGLNMSLFRQATQFFNGAVFHFATYDAIILYVKKVVDKGGVQ
jgi:hypothetical protein